MKTHKKLKTGLGVFLILAISVMADLTFQSISVQAGENFDISLQFSLYRMRPLFLVVFYIVSLTLGYLLIYRAYSDHFSSFLLIIVGISVLFGLTAPLWLNYPVIRDLNSILSKIFFSRLGLALHTGAIMTALGVSRVFLHFFQKRRV